MMNILFSLLFMVESHPKRFIRPESGIAKHNCTLLPSIIQTHRKKKIALQMLSFCLLCGSFPLKSSPLLFWPLEQQLISKRFFPPKMTFMIAHIDRIPALLSEILLKRVCHMAVHPNPLQAHFPRKNAIEIIIDLGGKQQVYDFLHRIYGSTFPHSEFDRKTFREQVCAELLDVESENLALYFVKKRNIILFIFEGGKIVQSFFVLLVLEWTELEKNISSIFYYYLNLVDLNHSGTSNPSSPWSDVCQNEKIICLRQSPLQSLTSRASRVDQTTNFTGRARTIIWYTNQIISVIDSRVWQFSKLMHRPRGCAASKTSPSLLIIVY